MSVMLWYTNQHALQAEGTESKKTARIAYLAGDKITGGKKKKKAVSF